MRTLERVLDKSGLSNRVLRVGLTVFAAAVALVADLRHLVLVYPVGVDLEIPLRAAERWQSGGAPYLASSFGAPPGATQPFLYPPWVLPPLSLLVDLPRFIVIAAWCSFCVGSTMFICRRLAFPIWSWPLVMAWPPILEPMIGGNVQLPIVAMFCGVFWKAGVGRTRDFQPVERSLDDRAHSGTRIGLIAALTTAIKVSQPHTWLAFLRRQPASAISGALIVAAMILVTVPITGIGIWGDWLRQLGRATDPNWELGGIAIARLISPVLGLIASGTAVAAILFALPRRNAGAWVGILAVVGASSLHSFGTIFLLPGMLLIRREVALVAAMLIATTTYEGTWAGIIVVSGAMALALIRPMILEISSPEGSTREAVSRPGSLSPGDGHG